MDISRREFLIVGGVAAACAALAGWRLTEATRQGYVRTVVRKRLDYLTFSDEVLDQFAQDFVYYAPAMNATRGKVVAMQGLYLSRLMGMVAGGSVADKIDAFEDKIASDFLKATDFFDEGADVTRSLEYVAFPDPYDGACRNPTAVIV